MDRPADQMHSQTPGDRSNEETPRPGLRVFNALPKNHLPFTIGSSSCEPLIVQGEVAVVDITDREPRDGQLYLRRFGSQENPSRELMIVEAIERNCEINGKTWLLAPYNRARGCEQIGDRLRDGRAIGWADGPFIHEGELAWYIRDRIVGRVVGVLLHDRPQSAQERENGVELGSGAEIDCDRVLRPSYFQSTGKFIIQPLASDPKS